MSIVQSDAALIDDIKEAYNDNEQWKKFIQQHDTQHEYDEVIDGLIYAKAGHRTQHDSPDRRAHALRGSHS